MFFKNIFRRKEKKEKTVGETINDTWKKLKEGKLTSNDLKEAVRITDNLAAIVRIAVVDPDKAEEILKEMKRRADWAEDMEKKMSS